MSRRQTGCLVRRIYLSGLGWLHSRRSDEHYYQVFIRPTISCAIQEQKSISRSGKVPLTLPSALLLPLQSRLELVKPRGPILPHPAIINNPKVIQRRAAIQKASHGEHLRGRDPVREDIGLGDCGNAELARPFVSRVCMVYVKEHAVQALDLLAAEAGGYVPAGNERVENTEGWFEVGFFEGIRGRLYRREQGENKAR